MPATLPNNKVVGHDWTAPVTQAKCEWYVDWKGERITIYYRDVWTNALWATRIPSVVAALGFGPDVVFVNATARQIEPGVLCEVQAVFTTTSWTATINTPPSTQSENATTTMVPIQQHSNWSAASGAGTPADTNSPWSQYWNSQTNDWYGVPYVSIPPSYLVPFKEFPVGSSTLTTTDYFDSEPDDVEPLLGSIATPAGKSDEAGQYLLLSGGKNPSGQFWVRKLVYQFRAFPWPTQIFPTS